MKDKFENKFIKRGTNVIHFEYLGSLISEDDILELEQKLHVHNLELSRFDTDGVIYASMDNFQLVTYFVISQPIINELLKNIGVNIVWETIKYIVLKIWKKVKTKQVANLTSKQKTQKEISFGIKVKLDKNTSFNFKLDGDIDDSTIENSLDKILDFINKQKLNKEFKHADMVCIDKKTKNWYKIDTEEELSRRNKK